MMERGEARGDNHVAPEEEESAVEDSDREEKTELFGASNEPDLVDPGAVPSKSRDYANRAQPAASAGKIGPGLYQVRQGDCLTSIAFRAGFDRETLWNHPKNAGLQRKRMDPNVLMPGDVVFIPERAAKQVDGETEVRHSFRRKRVPAKLGIRLMAFGLPRRNVEYILEIDGEMIRGTTDEEGYLECSIKPQASRGKLIVEPGENKDEYTVTLGGIDPIDEVSGLQGRLINLGYDCEMTGELDDRTKTAISLFQKEHDLEPTGEPDPRTREELERVHGK